MVKFSIYLNRRVIAMLKRENLPNGSKFLPYREDSFYKEVLRAVKQTGSGKSCSIAEMAKHLQVYQVPSIAEMS